VKVVILGVRDTGGTCYTLAHAINKITPEHQCVNIRGQSNFINYPSLVDMGQYNRSRIREMTYKADVIVFLGAMEPFFKALSLRKNKMRSKKKILLCMGSEWRYGRKALIAQADRVLVKYKIVLGGADMFLPYPEDQGSVDDNEVGYLPVVRSFSEIRRRHTLCKQDKAAVESFGVPTKKVVFVHAPTSETSKGSHLFYAAATQAMQACPNMTFQTLTRQPWVTVLQKLAQSHVLYDQAPPFPTAYGALQVACVQPSRYSVSPVD